MPKKRKEDVQPTASFPSHSEIDRSVRSALESWAHQKGPYPLPVLEFLVNEVGCQLDTIEDADDSAKDDEFYNPCWYTKGITNGELFYSVYRIISSMIENEKFAFGELTQADQQIFGSLLELARDLFLDRRGEGEFVGDSVDLWILYKWTREKSGFAVWTAENGDAVAPPPLGNLTSDDWKDIAEDVIEHFLDGEEDDYLELGLLDSDPHWPTAQEFRRAKAHIRWWYRLTRGNQRSANSGTASV
jgi:hypothetical protein